VQDTIIAAYSVGELLGAYVAGTRDWLYADITRWLESATNEAAATSASRMFLLLAGPGMGKSVFSAVVYNNLTARTRRDKFVMVGAAWVANWPIGLVIYAAQLAQAACRCMMHQISVSNICDHHLLNTNTTRAWHRPILG
jgi:hypothetical protein